MIKGSGSPNFHFISGICDFISKLMLRVPAAAFSYIHVIILQIREQFFLQMDVFRLAPYLARVKKMIPHVRKQMEEEERQRRFVESYQRKDPVMIIDPSQPVSLLDLYQGHDPHHHRNQIHPESAVSSLDSASAAWATKASKAPWGLRKRPASSAVRLEAYKERRRNWLNEFNNVRLTGKLRFRKTQSARNMDALDKQAKDQTEQHIYAEDGHELHPITCGRQFRDYCASTSLHGWRYLSEKKRNKLEQLFWLAWCIFGIGAAAYMMAKIWTKWERNPIITSVATTNYPVSNIVFPAVTICTVNKAATEKLIIQGCRYNFTLTQMKTIISVLVDPDARNNDHVNVGKNFVKPETALQYLRLVAPKCDDYLLSCRWNSAPAQCTQVFRLVLTDTGYCCTFNSIETKKERKDSKHDMEVMIQEQEYDYLQRAVWEYTDSFRGGKSTDNENSAGTSPVDNFNCVRQYDDDLFPGVCQYLEKCRTSTKCRERNKKKSNATSQQPIGSLGSTAPLNFFAESFPLKVAGAGRSRGLTLMLDTLRCDTVPTDSFKGLRVYVHNADDFPAVAERGYIVGPGMETQIGVTAVDTYSRNVLRGFKAVTRGCFFPDEFRLKFYKEYSRSACVIECETEFVNQECQCVNYFAPGNYSICTLKKYLDCVKKAVDIIQKKTVPSINTVTQSTNFNFKSKKDREQDRSCNQFCLPSCNETFYNVFVTAADFPNQPQANQTKMLREAIIEGGHSHLNDIAYVSGSISVLRVFFRESSIMQYKRDELFTWEDFVSNLGGVLGLCMGFSILSVVEVLYFFTVRMHMDKKRWEEKTTIAEMVR